MSSDLGLDPNDPLNLLLHNTAPTDESSTEESDTSGAQDWSKLSAMWSDQAAFKPYPELMDLTDFSMNMDMDYSSMGIDPNSLHFNPPGLNFSFDDQNPMSSTTFGESFPAFSFQYPTPTSSGSSEAASPQSFDKQRRLSVTSSSSSSGVSLSPLPESAPTPPSGYSSDNTSAKDEPPSTNEALLTAIVNDPAAELAQRVRQIAGVMLAVPMDGFTASLQGGAQGTAGKLPIPRLARPNSSPRSSVASTSSAASTPPPSTPPSSSGSPLNVVIAPQPPSFPASNASTPTSTVPANLPRPKTSHTTIERRYRTNLNARIQSLRMAVPALRVLEDRDGGNGKKIKKNIKGGVLVKGSGIGIDSSEDGSVIDVIDERGFVDGVKVARKCSKANVLGKAVEYIRVLKKREHRLKAEQAGLKALVSGLVGGPALIKEWEEQWRLRFGGEERDEVEGEDDEEDDDDSEDEDGGEGDEEAGRKRKRLKATTGPGAPKKPVEKKEKKPAPVVLTTDANGNQVPEKRKRGRPRKVIPPSVPIPGALAPQASATTVPTQDTVMHPPPITAQWQQTQQPQQYLLAVFAIFSFFNSPLTSSTMNHGASHNHQHTGKVLTALHPPLAYAPEILSQFNPPASSSPASPLSTTWAWKEYVQLFHLLISVLILASLVGQWFGLNFGFGVDKVVEKGRNLRERSKTKSSLKGSEGWLRLGEESVLDGDAASLSFFERLRIYRTITSKPQPSIDGLATAAMVMNSSTGLLGTFLRVKGRAIWNALKHRRHLKVAEEMVLESAQVSDACTLIPSASAHERTDGERVYSPLEVFACLMVKQRMKTHLGNLFREAVAGDEDVVLPSDMEDEKQEEEEMRRTIDAARELGGQVESLGKLFERVWKTSIIEMEDVESVLGATTNEVDGEIHSLFTALVLYRNLFAGDASSSETDSIADCMSSSAETVTGSTLLSPPPSPRTPQQSTVLIEQKARSLKHARMLLDLRTALGSRVFEDLRSQAGDAVDDGFGLEDARDRVVDLIVDAERRERIGSRLLSRC